MEGVWLLGVLRRRLSIARLSPTKPEFRTRCICCAGVRLRLRRLGQTESRFGMVEKQRSSDRHFGHLARSCSGAKTVLKPYFLRKIRSASQKPLTDSISFKSMPIGGRRVTACQYPHTMIWSGLLTQCLLKMPMCLQRESGAVAAPQNMCVIRSGQYWGACGDKELDYYQTKVHPTLLEGWTILPKMVPRQIAMRAA